MFRRGHITIPYLTNGEWKDNRCPLDFSWWVTPEGAWAIRPEDHALLRDKGMPDRDIALVWMAGVIEREINSTKELTVDDARIVIDALEALPDETYVEPNLLDDGDGA